MRVRCWGTRGTLPTPSQDRIEFGGNTACVEVSCGDDMVVLDAGSGLHALGNHLATQAQPKVHIFLSHFHWDHIQGIPFFAPLYNPQAEVTFYSSAAPEDCKGYLQVQMGAPFFPFEWDQLPARITYVELGPDPVQVNPLEVSSFALHHPQGSLGFRVSGDGKTVVYATDHEHGLDPAADARLVQAARKADLLLHDAQYTPDEYEQHRGWGHSSWQHATTCAKAAEVRKLLLFHHDPDRTDDAVKAFTADAAQEFPRVEAARETTYTLL